MKYMTPDTMTMTVYLIETIQLTLVFGVSRRSLRDILVFLIFLLQSKKNWIIICTTHQSVIQILFLIKPLVFDLTPNQPTLRICQKKQIGVPLADFQEIVVAFGIV